MREIIFRGKRIDNGEWVEGFYVSRLNASHYIIPCRIGGYVAMDGSFYVHEWYSVAPCTVGQYTGLTDKNGKKIFEGDIVKTERDVWSNPTRRGREILCSVVRYSEKDCSFGLHGKYRHHPLWRFKGDWNEVIGNIHDNPELLKGENDADI